MEHPVDQCNLCIFRQANAAGPRFLWNVWQEGRAVRRACNVQGGILTPPETNFKLPRAQNMRLMVLP